MEEASENGKESPHSVHANGLIDSCAVTIGLHGVVPRWGNHFCCAFTCLV